MLLQRMVVTGVFWLLACLPAVAGDPLPVPGGQERCPVCGMFVAKYPDWVASISFKDGTAVHFDGPKDLFTYYLNPRKYGPARPAATGASIQVKDYYGLKPINARQARYVIGSDVYGPMGKELIPFATAADARGFLHDHRGKRVLRFDEITPAVLKSLE